MEILFLGRDEFSCAIFEELHACRDVWQSITVATNPDTRTGRSPLRTLAESVNVPVAFIPEAKPDFKYWEPPPPFSVPAEPPHPNHDRVLVTASFGRILTPAQLDLFLPTRRLNVHGSVLPAFRGPAPIQHAVLDNATHTGVSVAQMLKRGIDKGPLWATAQMPIAGDATFTSLRDELAKLGGRVLIDVLRDMLAGTAKSTPQPTASPTRHARTITAADALLDFTTMTARDIVTRHRAISHQVRPAPRVPRPPPTPPLARADDLHDPALPAPDATTAPVPAMSAEPGAAVFDKRTKTLLVRCAQGSVLAVPRVKKERRAMLEARDFWNGVLPSAALLVRGELRLVSPNE
ncbi:formyl transferase [Mycena pura]|uniref:methionyl-tRNA formyltransferase n=1 Tax=Mycena pura TaxID=153505 RepID=A0AAD6UX21_9AGAR|nr:formyl transferase [Mycena pura]